MNRKYQHHEWRRFEPVQSEPQEQQAVDLRGTASTCSRGSSSTSPLSTATETTGRRRRHDHDSAQPRTLVKRERDQHKLFSHTETKDRNQIQTELQCSEQAAGSWIRTNLELTDPNPFQILKSHLILIGPNPLQNTWPHVYETHLAVWAGLHTSWGCPRGTRPWGPRCRTPGTRAESGRPLGVPRGPGSRSSHLHRSEGRPGEETWWVPGTVCRGRPGAVDQHLQRRGEGNVWRFHGNSSQEPVNVCKNFNQTFWCIKVTNQEVRTFQQEVGTFQQEVGMI